MRRLSSLCYQLYHALVILSPSAGFAPSYLGVTRARYLASSASSHRQPRFAGPRFASSGPIGALSLSALSAPTSRPLSERATKFLQQIPGDPIKGFEAADRAWTNVRSDSFTTPPSSPAVVEKPDESFLGTGASPDYDFVVCGGTLGIFVAAALQVRGYKVAVVEQGKLVGRTQEWNISRKVQSTSNILQSSWTICLSSLGNLTKSLDPWTPDTPKSLLTGARGPC